MLSTAYEEVAVSGTELSAGPSVGTARRTTNTAAATAVIESVLAGTGWSLADVYRSAVRLDPPLGYWAVYRIKVRRPAKSRGREDDRRRLTLVGRVCFDPEDWAEYRDWLWDLYEDAPCLPLRGLGHPIIVDERQLAWWFFPIDPHLQTLSEAADPREMRRLLAPRYSPKTTPARIEVEQVRYHPETSAVLRYTVVDRPGAQPRQLYGKLYREGRGRDLFEVTRQLWELSRRRSDLLTVAEPVAYDDALELHLEKAAPGEVVEGDRTHPVFLPAAVAAAEALAVLHDSDVVVDHQLVLEPELDRLDDVRTAMLQTYPRGAALLGELVDLLRSRLAEAAPEDTAVTHGDMKYDQLVAHEGRFALVDFEEVGMAETSWDLGKWCAHCFPSGPRTAQEHEAAEQARAAFLRRYRELRPAARLPRFPLYEATHLGNRAMVLMQAQGPEWEETVDGLLTTALDRLAGPCP